MSNFESIVNVNDLLVKEKLSNSDMILLIFDICLCRKKYGGYTESNLSVKFWEEVVNSGIGKKLLSYKANTMRKYWKLLCEVQDFARAIQIVRDNKNTIDNPYIKLLPAINAIRETIFKNATDISSCIKIPIKMTKANKATGVVSNNYLGKKRFLILDISNETSFTINKTQGYPLFTYL